MSHSSATMNKESSKVTGKNLDSNQSRDDCPTFSSNLSETWLVVGPFLCLTLMSKAAQTNTLNIIDHFSFATVNICLIKLRQTSLTVATGSSLLGQLVRV